MPKATLTAKYLENLKPPAKGRVEHFDKAEPGLALRVTDKGGMSWVLFYRPKAGEHAGKLRRYTLGTYPMMSLREARNAAGEAKEAVKIGADPAGEKIAEKQAAKAAANEDGPAAPETYEQAVEDYIRRYQDGERKNSTSPEIKRVLLKQGAEWKGKPVASLTAREIRRVLEDIRDGDDKKNIAPRPYLANRFYAYLRTFFRWAAEPGIEKVERSPMEGLRLPWDGEETRQRVFSDDELRALWGAADDLGMYEGAYLRLLLLTGKRKSALAAMQWSEIDDNGVWTPPQDTRRRRRNKRVHAVPLPALAREIIEKLPAVKDNPYVFVGRFDRGHLDPGSVLQKRIQEKSEVADFFFHALRHTAETKLAELGVQPHVRDMLFDHAPARGSGAGYDHHTYADEMRGALDRWGSYLLGLLNPEPEKVVRLRG